MQLHPRVGGSAWESDGRVFEVPPKCIEELASIKSFIKIAYAAQRRLKPGQELRDAIAYVLAAIELLDSNIGPSLDSASVA